MRRNYLHLQASTRLTLKVLASKAKRLKDKEILERDTQNIESLPFIDGVLLLAGTVIVGLDILFPFLVFLIVVVATSPGQM